MREIFRFIQWQWSKFEFWQKCFVGSSAFFGAALVADQPLANYLFAAPMLVTGSFLIKWVIIDGTRAAWGRYKKERNELLDTIKNSEFKAKS